MEKELTQELGIPFTSLDVQGLRRSFSLSNFKTLFKFVDSVSKSKQIIRNFDPDIVVGTGGYVSAPVLYKAARMKKKTIVFEPNSYPGLTNKLLGKLVTKVAVSNDDAKQYFPSSKIVFTGNPRSQEVYEESLAQKKHQSLKQEIPQVLIFGGSLGALQINNAAEEMIRQHDFKNIKIIFGSGRKYYADKKEILDKLNEKENVQIKPYINNMAELLPNISLIVSRSGATTIAEITALGVPAILIPSPNVTHDHQTYNAKSLSNENAAILLPEGELTSKKLYEMIMNLINDHHRLSEMKCKSFSLGERDAADRFINLMKELVGENAY